ncbi:CLUMA_CG004607, isoform A [Clunio marinus]|uniref:CLUMA_CG004607, isoform A n=1 Tax=Clunio marinus TaxID=568069 RepID=A0A1J1HWL7_9DIPT|nr:CLUMA_CG004607, isoform A [Clunio marinus]
MNEAETTAIKTSPQQRKATKHNYNLFFQGEHEVCLRKLLQKTKMRLIVDLFLANREGIKLKFITTLYSINIAISKHEDVNVKFKVGIFRLISFS